MNVPTFDAQRQAWKRIPVDDVGYMYGLELLSMTDSALHKIVWNAEHARYDGWRNYQNMWRQGLGLDSTGDKDVLDYGCGIGIEALQYARKGNRVQLADINTDSVKVAERVLKLYGYGAAWSFTVFGDVDDASLIAPRSLDVVHCAGVLHHIPDPMLTMKLFHHWLRPNGELRLMLYSDRGWQIATDTVPPGNVVGDPSFRKFVRYFDEVGEYADWYNEERLCERFGDLFLVRRFAYITPDDRYCIAILEPIP